MDPYLQGTDQSTEQPQNSNIDDLFMEFQTSEHSLQSCSIDVILEYELPERSTRELIPKVCAQMNNTGEILTSSVLEYLIEEEFKIEEFKVFVLDKEGYYLYVARSHTNISVEFIPLSGIQYQTDGRLQLTMKLKAPKLGLKKESETSQTEDSKSPDQLQRSGGGQLPSSAGEKTIGNVLNIIQRYRNAKLDGVTTSQAKQQVLNELGVQKGQVDYYIHIVKKAKQYGFDFQKYVDKGFKTARDFVKEESAKVELRRQRSSNDGSDTSEAIGVIQSSKKIDKKFGK